VSQPGLPPWRVEEHASLASTQQFLKQRLAGGEDVDGLVIRATEQPAGSGRRGKAWSSRPGGSYQSFAVRDRWAGGLRRPSLTLWSAVELAMAFRAHGAVVLVKWPNDLYLGGGKLAGVLSEHVNGHLVVGIGVNVNNSVPQSAAALTGWELPFVNALVLSAARRALTRCLSGGQAEAELPRRLAPLDQLALKHVTVKTPRGLVTGTALGVAPDGALLVRTTSEVVSVVDGSVVAWS
jgi:BirA family biotin operon repressor/biotin-[acetyl-CoA-carboxylase] ligase